MKTEATYLGQVIRVDSGTVEVEVSYTIPSSAPIIRGRVHRIGQVGTFVKIPVGGIVIYGIVASVSNAPSNPTDTANTARWGSRYLSIQLVGEKMGDDAFEKGIGSYPTINDEVHVVTEDDLRNIYGAKDKGTIELGRHASSENLSVYVDVHKLVLRHAAILGSTGSGKSNSTVSVIKAIVNDYDGSRVLLVDPHGEYSSAFPDAAVFKIGADKDPLVIPFWLMNFDELAFFLVGATSLDDQRTEYRNFRELVTRFKKKNVDLLAGKVDVDLITADSPIPFSARELWFEMNWWLNATFSSSNQDDQTKDTVEETDAGDFATLKPASFKPYPPNSKAPFKSRHQQYYSYEKRILSRLRDSRFDFLFNPGDYRGILRAPEEKGVKDLHDLLSAWIDSPSKLVILDLSGVPFEVLDITVGLITRFVYDSMFWGRDEDYTGKKRPLLVAYEEAHSYLSKRDDNGYSKAAVEQVFKEGRKFGMGAMVISQRPSELSETILAQVGTFIALRLSNSGDQGIVRSSAPDNLNSLMDLLPSLRTGEAIVVGEAIKVPSRVRLKLNSPRPTSDDPKLLEAWTKKHPKADGQYKSVVTKIRQRRFKP